MTVRSRPETVGGWFCGEHASAIGSTVWFGGYLVSFVATVALVVLAWHRWSWRGGIPALALIVALPLGTAWLLDLPSDDCTAHARATHPRWACYRSDGT